MLSLEGRILQPSGWLEGSIHFGERIARVEHNANNSSRHIVLPGFIDLHVHGGGGRDVMEGGDALATIAALHARHGTTSLLATTMTAPHASITAALAGVAQAMRSAPGAGARVLGAHLEGPYISPARLGAQPDCAVPGRLEDVLDFHALAPLRVLTLAPELNEHLPLIAALHAAGIRVQLGHSAADYETAVAAMAAGASGYTHLYNAMSALHHRAPGLVGAALAHAEYAELIPDLLHVHPGAIKAALRAIPHLYAVTDATAAAGMPDGDYQLGSQTVHKCLGGVRLADGTLAGSALTMDAALRNLVSIGLDLADASRRVSAYPAAYLGLADRGVLQVGAYADLVVLDENLQVQAVYVEGVRIGAVTNGHGYTNPPRIMKLIDFKH